MQYWVARAVNPAPTKKLEIREKNPATFPGGLLLGSAVFTASSAKDLENYKTHVIINRNVKSKTGKLM